MIIMMLSYAILLPTLTGFLFVSYFSRYEDKHNLFERLCFGFGMGTALLTFEMFIVGLLQIRFSLHLFSAVQILTMILFGSLLFKSKYTFIELFEFRLSSEMGIPFLNNSKAQLILFLLLTSWILLKFFLITRTSYILPVFAWDSLENWSSAAKFFFYEKGLALEHSEEHFFGTGYRTFLNYPLHVPLIQVWFSLCIGNIHEAYIKYWNVIYFISVVGLLFFALKREVSAIIAIFAAFFLSSVPLLTFHATQAYADLPLSYYALAVTVYFRKYMKSEQKDANYGILTVMGLFAAFCLWTKIEGVLFCLAFSTTLIFYLFLKRNGTKELLNSICFYLLPISIISFSWFSFILLNSISGRGLEGFLTSGLHFEVFPIIWDQIMFSANFNIIFIFFFTMLFLSIKSVFNSDLKYLLIALLLIMLMYLFIYVTTDNYKWVMDLAAINRNILTLIPMLYYISALMTVDLLKTTDRGR